MKTTARHAQCAMSERAREGETTSNSPPTASPRAAQCPWCRGVTTTTTTTMSSTTTTVHSQSHAAGRRRMSARTGDDGDARAPRLMSVFSRCRLNWSLPSACDGVIAAAVARTCRRRPSSSSLVVNLRRASNGETRARPPTPAITEIISVDWPSSRVNDCRHGSSSAAVQVASGDDDDDERRDRSTRVWRSLS